jgi:O-methyltransferase
MPNRPPVKVSPEPASVDAGAAEAYLDLLKRCLTRSIIGEEHVPFVLRRGTWKHSLYEPVRRALARLDMEIVRRVPFDPQKRAEGLDWPAHAETMIGLRRLDNLQSCVTDVLSTGVPGDLIETGVWRGGATIFMRGVLRAYGDTERIVWAADSFKGLPKPDPERWSADRGDKHWTNTRLAVSADEVRANFARYGLLDDQVRFLEGWFEDTLPSAPIERLALVRLDGDMYGSTMVALEALYPKLSPGGYLIVDDYSLPNCRQAVSDYREAQGIRQPIEPIGGYSAYWQKTGEFLGSAGGE